MNIAHKNLKGLDEARLLAILEPILLSHRLDAVELVWKGDQGGRVLELTLEKPGSTRSGEGITIDLCSAISRELSAKLDDQSVISGKYRLEVGSPGVERALYLLDDFRRFAGQTVKVKLKEPMQQEGFIGQRSARGNLFGVSEDGRVVLDTDAGQLALELDMISSARLVFNWNQSANKTKRSKATAASVAKTRKQDREQ